MENQFRMAIENLTMRHYLIFLLLYICLTAAAAEMIRGVKGSFDPRSITLGQISAVQIFNHNSAVHSFIANLVLFLNQRVILSSRRSFVTVPSYAARIINVLLL
jgi:hypothetical protein